MTSSGEADAEPGGDPEADAEPGGGPDRIRRRRRFRFAAVIGGIVALIALWGALLAVRTLAAYHHDQRGLAALEEVRSNLTAGSVTSDRAIHVLDRARYEFDSAATALSSPLFTPIVVVPVIGRQFQSVRALSSAAATVSSVGSSFLTRVHGVLGEPHGAGPERVAALRQLASISAAARDRLATVGTGPSEALVAPLARRHNEFVSQLDAARSRLSNAAAASAAAAQILEGTQTYLVLASNNAEMRNGSGTYLDVGVATTSDGTVHVGQFVPSGAHTLPVGAVPVTGDLQRNWGWLHPSLDLRNLGFTPQFNVTAPLAARMWTALTGQQVDGVLALDTVAVQQLLEATGPVQVGAQSIDAANAVQYLMHGQYAGLTDAGGSQQRQDALGTLTSAILHQLQSQSIDLRSLATALSSAVAGRHLMLWSKNPAQEAAWVTSGVSGRLTSRSVGVGLVNLGGNKLDQYVPVHVDVTTSPSRTSTQVTMTIHVVNDTPPGQSSFIAGPFPGVDVGYGGYSGLVTANVPGSANDITMTGSGPVAVLGPDGPTGVIAAPIVVNDGASATVVVRFRVPGAHGAMSVFSSARVPTVVWSAEGQTFSDSAPRTIRW